MLISYSQNLVVFFAAVLGRIQFTLNAINYCVEGIKKYVSFVLDRENFTIFDDDVQI